MGWYFSHWPSLAIGPGPPVTSQIKMVATRGRGSGTPRGLPVLYDFVISRSENDSACPPIWERNRCLCLYK